MAKKTIHLIAAARPNFMKIAPLYHALAGEPWADTVLVHTGQHYDLNMSEAFFRDLNLPAPDINLGVGSGSHAEQTGKVMMAYEKILMEMCPDLVVVVGDVNSTLACTLAAVKVVCDSSHSIRRPRVAHLEAGLRSFDRSMPEEINRIVTDSLADLLWTPSPDADENLLREGVSREKIERVGNIMIDSLEMLRPKIEQQEVCRQLGLAPGMFGLVTLHRPANVDTIETLAPLVESLCSICRQVPLVFPVHPRTRKSLEEKGLIGKLEACQGMTLLEPLNYVRFMNLVFNCALVITDSGGIQEETTYLGIPCLTLRPNTERPITVEQGTNRLCEAHQLEELVAAALAARKATSPPPPELWDGNTAARVVESIGKFLQPAKHAVC